MINWKWCRVYNIDMLVMCYGDARNLLEIYYGYGRCMWVVGVVCISFSVRIYVWDVYYGMRTNMLGMCL